MYFIVNEGSTTLDFRRLSLRFSHCVHRIGQELNLDLMNETGI